MTKLGGIHGLRHAYATHMLERGVPVHQLQHLLGHSSLRYLHWLPNQLRGGVASGSDLLAGLEVGRG